MVRRNRSRNRPSYRNRIGATALVRLTIQKRLGRAELDLGRFLFETSSIQTVSKSSSLNPAAFIALGVSDALVSPGIVLISRNQMSPCLSTIISVRERCRAPIMACAVRAMSLSRSARLSSMGAGQSSSHNAGSYLLS